MTNSVSRIFFDKNDHQLLQIVNDVLERGPQSQMIRSLLVEHMHPQGIKEMAASRGLRIAYAIVSLLGSFEKGLAGDRIKALRSLRDEVFLSSPSFYQKNTARVLLQIMKELVRSRDNKMRQLKLAHDFRIVSMGNPRRIRKELAKYHLVEMPEQWNQFAFDDHVHDANTKGRKSPTHLIMDAWIKGIRGLTVVYYNYVRPEVMEELVEASAILDIRVKVGIEFSTRFRDKYARFTWEPDGFDDNRAFLDFSKEEAVTKLFDEGREVSQYQQQYVFDVLDVFNKRHRDTLNKELGLSFPLLNREDFHHFVGTGQPSVLHLARFIHNTLIGYIKTYFAQHAAGETTAENTIHVALREKVKRLNVECIINDYLLPVHNPEVHDPSVPQDSADLPQLLQCSFSELLTRLLSLHSSSKFTLNLSNLSAQDTLELLYAGAGRITHIEAYNLKSISHSMRSGITGDADTLPGEGTGIKNPATHDNLISQLQKALNDDNVIGLKRAIRDIIWDYEEQQLSLKKQVRKMPVESSAHHKLTVQVQLMQARKLQLIDILYDLETFHNYYKKRSLRSHIGTGSTGQEEHQYGMGLVVLDTLPARGRKAFHQKKGENDRTLIPVSALLTKQSLSRQYPLAESVVNASWLCRLPLFKSYGKKHWVKWSLDGLQLHVGRPGNIGTLGGLNVQTEVDLLLSPETEKESVGEPWKYLNTNVKNTAKVLLGLIPAFFTFSLTKDWWVLAYFGAFIWFGITGLRNIIQSVLGGGGLRRSPLLPWNSLISWSRISDSLLYTGFSVPLLDFLVKTLILDQTFGVTTSTNPVLLYSVMGLANGVYISSHNALRGLPKGATIGNFFRSIVAIPLAIVLNSLIGFLLYLTGIPDTAGVLQRWAAIISKFASDCVASVIEGIADRQTSVRARMAAYRTKISQLFTVFSRLDLIFPEEDVLQMLQSPKVMMKTLNNEARDLEKLIIVNALDLMYFWMYQPRARKALTTILRSMSEEEWLIFYRSQLILKRHKEISQFFIDGLVGKQFSKALSFYLDQSTSYLADMKKLGVARKR